MTMLPTVRRAALLASTMLALAACQDFDYDMRSATGGFSTADAARNAVADRPQPDNRGIISYPNYQVAVAQRGDTVADVAARVGVADAQRLASFNGLPVDAPLRANEVIVLPVRVAEPSPATGAISAGPIQPAAGVDVTTLAGQAIESAPQTAATAPAAAAPQTGREPVRHKVKRGETAYSIARAYNVRVADLAKWNGLDARFTVREGQFLLIPVAGTPPPGLQSAAVTQPGQGSPTPVPPSAAQPLPADKTPPKAKPVPKPQTDLGPATQTADTGRFVFPVDGKVVREFVRGKNENLNIQAAPGAPVKAAAAGTVAAITENASGIPIMVIRHDKEISTVYANITGISVKKGDTVTRGQTIAKLRGSGQNYLHFEVRKGFDSEDPNKYLN